MGIFLRKSFRVGPIRINLSKSGLGLSLGAKGFRISSGPKGSRLHIGAGGLYYQGAIPELMLPSSILDRAASGLLNSNGLSESVIHPRIQQIDHEICGLQVGKERCQHEIRQVSRTTRYAYRRWLQIAIGFRQPLLGMTDATWFVGLILIVPLLASFTSLLLAPYAQTSLTAMSLVAVAAWLVTALSLALLFFVPGTNSLLDKKAAVERQISTNEQFIADGRRCIGSLDSRIESLLVERRRIQETVEYRRAVIRERALELLTFPWQDANGVEFEQFLEKVFVNLGGRVTGTPISGDQGVDLIITFGSRKIAVQVKGSISTIGNGAVQEVVSGQLYYGCGECVVITNNYFTRNAKDLANRTHCRLIERDDIENLVFGLNPYFANQI